MSPGLVWSVLVGRQWLLSGLASWYQAAHVQRLQGDERGWFGSVQAEVKVS